MDYSKWNNIDCSDSESSDSESGGDDDMMPSSNINMKSIDGVYSDEKEDRAAFGSIDEWEVYQYELRPVKHNNPNATFLKLNMYANFTDEAWARVGNCLKNNTHVRNLGLSGCNLDSDKLESLMEGGMDQNTSLRGLVLDQNEHVFYDRGSEVLASYLRKNKNIKDLSLVDTNVTPDELRVLVPALDGSNIEVLDIQGGMLQDDMNPNAVELPIGASLENTPSWKGVREIFADIHLPELIDLNLSHCQASGECCKWIVHLANKKGSKLRSVDLSSNFLYGVCVDDILKDGLKENTTLKHLDLSYNEDIEEWVEEWIAELKEKKSSLEVTYKV